MIGAIRLTLFSYRFEFSIPDPILGGGEGGGGSAVRLRVSCLPCACNSVEPIGVNWWEDWKVLFMILIHRNFVCASRLRIASISVFLSRSSSRARLTLRTWVGMVLSWCTPRVGLPRRTTSPVMSGEIARSAAHCLGQY